MSPPATDTYLTWSRNSATDLIHFSVYARQFGGPAFRVSAAGTSGGSTGIDGTTIVYSQRPPGGHLNLHLFDVVGKVRSALPAIVNTRRGEEYGPSISGDWIEFARQTRRFYREFIYNRTTHELRMLDETSRARRFNSIEPGQVNGNYVAWMRCGRVTCRVKLYDITTQTTSVLTPPSGRYQFGAAVTADGTLYYGEANLTRCGRAVKLKTLPLAGSPTTLVSFNRGVDFYSTFAYTNVTGTDLYYAKLNCATNKTDLFRVTNP